MARYCAYNFIIYWTHILATFAVGHRKCFAVVVLYGGRCFGSNVCDPSRWQALRSGRCLVWIFVLTGLLAYSISQPLWPSGPSGHLPKLQVSAEKQPGDRLEYFKICKL